ncbi:glutamate-5-semialdehyde dehydrogenase [Marinicauda algicola]|uniref:Gamma-glutamyl phosphate reductase n=1 Tax=Marinicauda algicola TaxID=2029849 RepID=A0A4S2GZY0_9PROT|nr:glutamate-5-semialdehyde dehydrogenase [Marinicauda algicola]TGY88817.1 glutamate-5-semialdehyde dehydrogenase [Marinicauda algicola]
MDYMTDMARMCAEARAGAAALQAAGEEGRTRALKAMAQAIRAASADILAANAREVEAARQKGADKAFADRLTLDEERLNAVADGVATIAEQDDPVGVEKRRWTRPNGLEIAEVSIPLGVIGVIFESRPNVAADAAALCVRAGNGVILRGGSEAAGTTQEIVKAVRTGLAEAGLPEGTVQTPPDAGRGWVTALLALDEGGADLVIPRGGKPLIAHVREHAKVPVLSHLDGICHVYVDARADARKAIDIVLDSKMRRTGVCNAAETLLIDRACASDLLPRLARALEEKGCELRGDEAARSIVPSMNAASEEDWDTEYLDAILSVRVVDGADAAMDHIARHGSGHTEVIVTEDETTAQRMISGIDAAVIMHNASSAFSDGGEFGYGGEIGIATGRLHARGPVGAAQLTTNKYVVHGEGQIRG